MCSASTESRVRVQHRARRGPVLQGWTHSVPVERLEWVGALELRHPELPIIQREVKWAAA